MQFINEEARLLWAKGLKNNEDGYGRAIYQWAEDWALLMEISMPVGEFVDSMAERAERKSCKDKGYTGFMNGAAASIIASAWARGEEFRKWYNLKTQFGTEGEDANEKEGAILNPALMSIG